MLQRELTVLTHKILQRHPNLVRLLFYDLVRDGDDVVTPALIMERARHGTLTSFLAQNHGSLTESEKVGLCWDAASGLCALHRCGVVHGDVKTDNVLVFDYTNHSNGRRYKAKLTDFGSCIFTKTIETARYYGTRTTNAPETVDQSGNQAIVASMLPRCDIYSLGLIFLQVVAESFEERWTTKDPTVLENALKYVDASGLSANVRQVFNHVLRLVLQWAPQQRCGDLSIVLDILNPYQLNHEER